MSLIGLKVKICNALSITNADASRTTEFTVVANYGIGANLNKTGNMIITQHFQDRDEMGTKAIRIISSKGDIFLFKTVDMKGSYFFQREFLKN